VDCQAGKGYSLARGTAASDQITDETTCRPVSKERLP
jgi:hypothetical protein